MRKLLLFTVLLGLFMNLSAQTQVEVVYKKAEKEPDIEKLREQIDNIEQKEKKLLKKEVNSINEALDKGEITEEEAEKQKREAAVKRAKNINDQIKIIESNIDLISRNLAEGDDLLYYQNMEYLRIKEDSTVTESHFKKTHSDLIIGFGFSNARRTGTSIGDDYRVAGSRYFEIGYEGTTGLPPDNMRIAYGLMLQFDGLKPKGNDVYFVETDGVVEVQEFENSIKKAKLRMSNLVVPLHLEIGPTNKYGYHDKFRLGFGGFVGVNLSTIQKLKYRDEHNRLKKTKDRFNSQAEDFVYGWSGYIGYRNMTLMVRYHMNPIFKDNPVEEKMITAGLRMNL